MVTTAGTCQWLRGTAQAVRDPHGDVLWSGVVLDVTETHQQIERQQQQEHRQLENAIVRKTEALHRLSARLHEKRRDRAQFEHNLRTIFNGVYDALFVHTVEGQLLDVNAQTLEMYAIPGEQAGHFSMLDYYDGPGEELKDLWQTVLQGKNQFYEGKARRPLDGSTFDAEVFLRKLTLGDRDVILTNVRDVTLRKQAEEALRQSEASEREKSRQLEALLRELQHTQTQLVQSEKMSSLGQLVAGVAHEINNPVNFIYGNLRHATAYTQDLLKLLQHYQTYYPNPVAELQAEIDEIDLDFLLADLPKLLSSMKVGADRIREIVQSLRNFSRLDESEVKAVNLHEGLDSTLMILQNRIKAQPNRSAIQVLKHYGDLPLVECFAGQLNQVFMNMLVNAIDALEETDQFSPLPIPDPTALPHLPTILIRTSHNDTMAVIELVDNGKGMDEAIQQRLFDPFFTTKPIGKGTGLGMSISHQVVVEKHGGELQCVSQPGQGTQFMIKIPIKRQSSDSGQPRDAIAQSHSCHPTGHHPDTAAVGGP